MPKPLTGSRIWCLIWVKKSRASFSFYSVLRFKEARNSIFTDTVQMS